MPLQSISPGADYQRASADGHGSPAALVRISAVSPPARVPGAGILSFSWDAALRQFLPEAHKTDGEVFKQYNVFRLKEKLHSPTLV